MKRVHLLILLTLLYSDILADKYVVVSNKKMQDISQSQLRAIYLKKLSILGGVRLVPVNLQARSFLRVNFENRVLNMSFERLKSYWSAQHYLGHRPPLSMQSQESIIAFIKRVDGAIGYIKAEKLDAELKVLYEWED